MSWLPTKKLVSNIVAVLAGPREHVRVRGTKTLGAVVCHYAGGMTIAPYTTSISSHNLCRLDYLSAPNPFHAVCSYVHIGLKYILGILLKLN